MKKADAIAHFGSQVKIAEALGITKSSVSQWGDEVPELRAFQIELLTGGKLKVAPLKQNCPQASLAA